MTANGSPAHPLMQPPESGVTVRLYNPGFGDCLLLAFRAEDGTARYMLVDCGVHHGYPNRAARMRLIAEDIAQATAHHLHVVAVTHEHTDHLLGFELGREAFESIAIDELWLSWTEDPADPVATALKQTYGLRIRALAAAIQQLGLVQDPLAVALQGMLDFEYPDALAATTGNAAQLEFLRTKSKKKLQNHEDYCRPGDPPLALPGIHGVQVYVLGPPKSANWIRRLQQESEMYSKLAVMDALDALTAALLAGTESRSTTPSTTQPSADADELLLRQSRPFDPSLEISKEAAQVHPDYGPFFRRSYGFSAEGEHGPPWRRIDNDWLTSAEQLALDINGKTNNTSLVLAIELSGTQPCKVVLLAADAQVGNWLSWHELSWPAGEQGTPVTAADLLQHTVLYKTGHHGSRNATLSGKGLELMQGPGLVAMIPVDQEWASEQMHWEHPAEGLLQRLQERTHGRIIRTDYIPSGDTPPQRPIEATEEEWQAFLQQLDWDRSPEKLWIQYTVLA